MSQALFQMQGIDAQTYKTLSFHKFMEETDSEHEIVFYGTCRHR